MYSCYRFGHEGVFMIDINLIRPQKQKSTQTMPVLFGIDVRAIKVKVLVITIVGCYVGRILFSWLLAIRIEGFKEESVTLEKTLSGLRKELSSTKHLETKLNEFNKKIKELKQRETEVNSVLSKKTNPYKLLENVAREMPEDLWFSKIQITSKHEILFEGTAVSYKSIGNFITKNNETPYFNQSLKLLDSTTFTQQNGSKTIRLERFGINGSVANFDLFGN